jgi:hypothetical protein
VALTERDRRALFVLGGVALLGIILFVFVLPKGGGGGGENATSPLPSVSPPTVPPPTPPAGQGGGHEGNAIVPIFEGRDPFKPLVGGGGGGASPSPGGSTSPPPTSPPPSETTSPSPTTSPSGGGGGGGTRTHHRGHTIQLDDLFMKNGRQMAQVEVDGNVYTVRVKEVFADDFEIVSIDGDCATFRHDDSEFALCLNPQK